MIAAAKPCNLKYSDISNYAEAVGQHHAIYDALGNADIEALVKRLGGKISKNAGDESLEVLAPSSFVVNIPTHTSEWRDRFTIAHELAHYFLHYRYAELDGPRKFGRGRKDRAETEANVFASALLMPSEEFKRAHKQLDGDVWSLARRFDVSPAAAEVRAQVLGII